MAADSDIYEKKSDELLPNDRNEQQTTLRPNSEQPQAANDAPSDKSSLQGPTPEDSEYQWPYQRLSPLHEIAFVALICATQFMTQAALGQVILPIRALAAGLKVTSPSDLSWAIAAYSLTVGTFVLPAGRLGDMYGSKRMLIIGWGWFGLWSIIAGLSVFIKSDGDGRLIMFATCQALRGIGPAILLPNGVAILGRSYPNSNRKNGAFAAFAMCAPTGALIGGAFGAIFGQLAWWPWTFWSFGIAVVGIGALSWVVVPEDEKIGRSEKQVFDYGGAALGVAGLVLSNVAWNQAVVVGWPRAYVPVLLALGVLLLAAFAFWERKFKQPLLPKEVFNVGTVTILAITSLGWQSFGVALFYTVQIVTYIRGNGPLTTVAQFSPIAVTGFLAAVVTGLSIKFLPHHWLVCISALAFTVGNVLVSTMPEHQIYWAQLFVGLLIIPFG
jgi:MFS family permease